MSKSFVKQSKFISLVLRHQPEAIGLTLDANGWANVAELLTKAKAHGQDISRERLEQIVAENDKKRFTFNDDGSRIRANQGHSVEVDLALQPSEPPELLFHGTATKNLNSIRATGLHSGQRQHVHLSADRETAIKVGSRHGQPVVLIVQAQVLHQTGQPFYLSDNGVWLTEAVPPEYLTIPVE